MKKLISAAVLAVGMLCVNSVRAETDYVAMPVIQDILKGVDNGNTPIALAVKPRAGVAAQTVVVGPSATSIYMTQAGTNNMQGGTIATNVFSPVFIEAPVVVYQFNDALKPATNVIVSASNAFTIATAPLAGRWIAVGKVK